MTMMNAAILSVRPARTAPRHGLMLRHLGQRSLSACPIASQCIGCGISFPRRIMLHASGVRPVASSDAHVDRASARPVASQGGLNEMRQGVKFCRVIY
jgi:hypothetical protein